MTTINDRLGRRTCDILKGIRKQIALSNNIPLNIETCTYLGDCDGHCPVCESELKYLESCLEQLKQQGSPIRVEGICRDFRDVKDLMQRRFSTKEIAENI